MHEEVIPHLTVAEGAADLQDEVEEAVTPSLPIEAEATSVSLFLEDETGWWSRDERYSLGRP
jgi:hypothetical protein